MGAEMILLPSLVTGPLLCAYVAIAILRARGAIATRVYLRLLAVLLLGGLIAYAAPPFGRVSATTGARHIHYHDVYHYFLGTKYFAELGYDGLYEATVVADWEDDREHFRPGVRTRDLRDGVSMVTRAALIQRTRMKRRFSPERWAEFKSDVAFFRPADPDRWRRGAVQRDHGYNGTPLTTAVLGFLGNHAPGDTRSFLLTVVWADLVSILALGLVAGLALGPEAGLTLLFFWFVNPFNGYEYVGGSFLRYAYFVALALGLVGFRRGWSAASGVALALATAFRLFPALFVVGLAAADLVSRDRSARLGAHRRLYAAFCITAVLVVGATSLVDSPDGRNAWVAFAERITENENAPAPNLVGLRAPFMYASEHNVAAVLRQGGAIDWAEESMKTFEARRPLYLACAASLLLLCAVYARRTGPSEAPFLGIFALFVLVFATSYYYCLLALVPLIFEEDARIGVPLAVTMILVTVTGWSIMGVRDLRFLVYSIEIFALLLGVMLWKIAPRSAPRPGG